MYKSGEYIIVLSEEEWATEIQTLILWPALENNKKLHKLSQLNKNITCKRMCNKGHNQAFFFCYHWVHTTRGIYSVLILKRTYCKDCCRTIESECGYTLQQPKDLFNLPRVSTNGGSGEALLNAGTRVRWTPGLLCSAEWGGSAFYFTHREREGSWSRQRPEEALYCTQEPGRGLLL